MAVNSKVALAFAAGALLASGVVYVALRPVSRQRHVDVVLPPIRVVRPQPVVLAAPETDPPPENAPEGRQPETQPVPAKSSSTPAAGPHSHKPSPMPEPPPAATAQAVPPPADDDVPASVRDDPPAAPAVAPEPPPAGHPAPEPAAAATLPPVPPAESPKVTLRAGMIINVRLSEALSSEKNEKDDTFFATLDAPVAADGFVIAERGARAEGRVVEVTRGGRGNGAAHLALQLIALQTSDGQRVALDTASFDKKADTSGGEDVAKVGGGAVLGAVIGAIAGGGKGAGIGAVAGGAAGAGGAVLTHGRVVKLPVETRISFRLQRQVTVTERQH